MLELFMQSVLRVLKLPQEPVAYLRDLNKSAKEWGMGV